MVGVNKKALINNWNLFNKKQFSKYLLEPNPKESIIKHFVVKNPDYNNLEALSQQIESIAIDFVYDINDFVEKLD